MINTDSALFTDLTAEEGATISGGLQLLIKSIDCIYAGADIVGADDTMLKVDGQKIWEGDMGSGSRKVFDQPLAVNVSNGSAVGLYDEDGWFSRDDYMGGFTVNGTQSPKTITVSGSNSMYQITYAVLDSVNPF